LKKNKNANKNGGKAMRSNYVQMSLFDTYRGVEDALENDKPLLFRLLDENIDWGELIPTGFYYAFYKRFGRPRDYHLESFLRMLLVQRIFHFVEDSQLLNVLRCCREMRDFCGLHKVPDAGKLTLFKQDFCGWLRRVFERLVEFTEPICREMDAALADMLIKDTTGIESYVTENNPKFVLLKEKQAKSYAKVNPDFDAEKGRHAFMPQAAESNSEVKYEYINGHYCYAQKAAILSNGLGIVRHIDLFDQDFRLRHPEIPTEKRSKDPKIDKEIGDSTALKPVLQDFRAAHPNLRYGTFAGDSAFDSYDNYSFLLKEYGFKRAIIPLNERNSAIPDETQCNEHGTPLCPRTKEPFTFVGICRGKHRSMRLKFVCPGSTKSRNTRLCTCQSPCTPSKYGRCTYVYPDKDLRLYPGISRDDPDFDTLYKRRAAVERTISQFKLSLCLDGRKTSDVLTTKADLFLAGISQLVCVLLAGRLNDLSLARRPRILLAA
jgi:hypothetical protein